jgi:hypothetical protein
MRGAMLCLTAAATLLTGCASENWLRLKKESFPTASAKNPVVRVLAVWQVGEGQGPDGLTTRGFAGQIFFLDAKDQIPAKVDGEVRVYVFDDQGSAEDRDKPLHQFDYPRESWKVRMTPTKMGPAYVVFVPYTRKGSHKAVCSLRLRYTPADGGAPLFSDMAQVSLPGRDGSDEERFALEKSRERTAEHLSDDPSADLPQRDVARRPSASRNVDESAHARESSRTTRQSPETIASHSRAEPRRAAPLTAREKERLVAEALARAEAEGLPVAHASDRRDARDDGMGEHRIQRTSYVDDSRAFEDVDDADEREVRSPRRGGHPLRRASVDDAVEPSDEDREFAEDDRPSRSRRHAPAADALTRRGGHPLLRDRSESDFDDADIADESRTSAHRRPSVNRLSRVERSRDEEPSPDRSAEERELDALEQAAIEELAQMSSADRDPARRGMRTWSVDMPR